MKSHEWLVIARCGILQYMIIDEVQPEIFDAIAGLLHQLALLTSTEITTDSDKRSQERDNLVAALALFELRMPVTELTALLHATGIHLFDDITVWGPAVNTWMFPNESYLGWLGSLISDRAHPIANLMNMHRVFRALCDVPMGVLREMYDTIARGAVVNVEFVKRLTGWLNRSQVDRTTIGISIPQSATATELLRLADMPIGSSASQALSVAMYVSNRTVRNLGRLFEDLPDEYVLGSRGRRCKSLLDWRGEGLRTLLPGRAWAATWTQLRAPVQLEQVCRRVTINGVVWEAAWREDRSTRGRTRTRCKSTFMISGRTLQQYANASRRINRDYTAEWFLRDTSTYYGRVLMFIRCRCHGLQSWVYLAVVTLREARVGPFVGCGTISGRSKEAPIHIVSAYHLHSQTLSLPQPEYINGRGQLSILTYHRRDHY
jgi:hypothetical protein